MAPQTNILRLKKRASMYATTGQGASEKGIGSRMTVNGSPISSKLECAKLAPQRSVNELGDGSMSNFDILKYLVVPRSIERYHLNF